MIFQMWNGAWNKLQFKVCQVAHACLDNRSMVSVVSLIQNGDNFLLKFFNLLM